MDTHTCRLLYVQIGSTELKSIKELLYFHTFETLIIKHMNSLDILFTMGLIFVNIDNT